MPNIQTRLMPAAVAAAALLAAAFTTCSAHAAGLDIHSDADAATIGLPVYPGAVKKAEKDDDTPGLSFGLWGGSFGIKLAVVSYRSADGVDPVAGFYRDALAKYGPVLDCSQNKPKSKSKDKSTSGGRSADIDSDAKDSPLTCEDDAPDTAGGRLYKVGTHHDQRLVEVEPRHAGVSIQMVRIETRGTD